MTRIRGVGARRSRTAAGPLRDMPIGDGCSTPATPDLERQIFSAIEHKRDESDLDHSGSRAELADYRITAVFLVLASLTGSHFPIGFLN